MRSGILAFLFLLQGASLLGGSYTGNGVSFSYDDGCAISESHDSAHRVRLQCGGDIFTVVVIGQKPGPLIIRLVNYRLLSSLIDRLDSDEKKTVTVVSEGEIDFTAGLQSYKAIERMVYYREKGKDRQRREILIPSGERMYMIIRAGDRHAPDVFRSTIDSFRIHGEP